MIAFIKRFTIKTVKVRMNADYSTWLVKVVRRGTLMESAKSVTVLKTYHFVLSSDLLGGMRGK